MFSVDYLSAILSPAYSLNDWLQDANETIIDPLTEVIKGRKHEKNDYRIDRRGQNTTLSCYHGKEHYLSLIVNSFGLKVTRLDLAADIFVPKDNDHIDECNFIADLVKDFYLHKRRKISYQYNTSVDAFGGHTITHLWGKRASRYQLRLYTKTMVEGDFTRIEFQLRGHTARQVYADLGDSILNQDNLMTAFFRLEKALLEPGIFPIEREDLWLEPLEPEPERISDRKAWIVNQVLPAIIKEFKATGENLAEFILAEFNRHFITGIEMMNSQDVLDATKG